MISKEEAKEKIKKLIVEFSEFSKDELNRKSEFQIQSEFIDPLFEALGWDMRKDVEREQRVLKGRADYIFRLGNQEFLVVEAKKTSVSLGEDQGRQAVSYAYHRKIKFSILTNFKYIRIYHALSNIKNIDKNLLFWLEFKDFEKEFEKLWLISKESFEKQEINKLLSKKDEQKYKPIDESILIDLLQFRDWLSKDLKKLRTYLTQEQIDEIVQILIDRLIFMRSVEDRGLEEKDFLLKIVKDYEQGRTTRRLWEILKTQFRIFDKMYNSKLFVEGLLEKEGFFDEKILIKIINGLYYGTQHQQERYMFDEIPGDLLGSIYEQYLGTILRGTEKRVKLDLETGKRKKMGIYYTPSYIVDYIVKNTVGEYIKDKTIDEILEIKILDPACGSGSFLIRAFQEVCNVIEEKLNKGEKPKKSISFKNYKERLSLLQKSTILKSCIYGVDLDEKAVELAQLNLMLKLLEDETRETRDRILPLMKHNIKCGNSLIDDPKVAGDKAFNWHAQFPEVFSDGGFDVVVGNPPYIRNTKLPIKEKNFFNKKYSSSYKQYDIYVLFFELGIKILKDKGLLGFITSNKFIASDYGNKIRDLILSKSRIRYLVDVSNIRVFKDASTYPIILILQKEEKELLRNKNKISFINVDEEKEIMENKFIEVEQSGFVKKDNKLVQSSGDEKFELIKKIKEGSKEVGDLFLCQRGSPKNKIKIKNESTKDAIHCIISKEVERYNHNISDKFFVISKLQDNIIDKKKILLPRTVLSLKASYEKGKNFIMDRIYYLISKEKIKINFLYVLGLLNSRLMDFYYKTKFETTHVGGGYLDLRGVQIKELPIATPTPKQEQRIIFFVNQMLELQKKFHGEKIAGGEKERLEQQIKNIDYEIDQEVYKLYRLTKDEVKVVGGSLR